MKKDLSPQAHTPWTDSALNTHLAASLREPSERYCREETAFLESLPHVSQEQAIQSGKLISFPWRSASAVAAAFTLSVAVFFFRPSTTSEPITSENDFWSIVAGLFDDDEIEFLLQHEDTFFASVDTDLTESDWYLIP
jgi:hypothetical protein